MKTHHPNFLVVGAQKCGTSYLCAVLAQRPEVFHTDPKEPLFFQRADVSGENYQHYLRKFYAEVVNEPLIGEGSTVYFQWPNALENIRTHLSDKLKIIICLRHPTDRAVSFYLHNLKKKRLTGRERIRDVGSNVRDSPMLSSMYASHLKRWLDAYGSKVKVLLFDDLLASPTAFVTQATNFLGLEPAGEIGQKAVNKGFGLEWSDGALTLSGTEGDTGPRFTRSELEDLHASFAQDIDQTEKLLGVPLAPWKRMPEFTAKQSGW